MKNKGFIYKFINSLYNIREIPNFIMEGILRAILYGVLIAVLFGGIEGIFISSKLNTYINSAVNQIKLNSEEFKIEDNLLYIENDIKVEEGSSLIYVSDNYTMDEIESLKSMTVHYNDYILLLKDGIVINSSVSVNNTGITKNSYSSMFFGEANITMDEIVGVLEQSKPIVISVTLGMSIFYTLIKGFMDSVIIAALLLISNLLFKLGLRFSNLFSLAIYASTLPRLFVMVLGMLFSGVYFDSVAMCGTFLFAFFVLRYMRNDIEDNMNIL